MCPRNFLAVSLPTILIRLRVKYLVPCGHLIPNSFVEISFQIWLLLMEHGINDVILYKVFEIQYYIILRGEGDLRQEARRVHRLGAKVEREVHHLDRTISLQVVLALQR